MPAGRLGDNVDAGYSVGVLGEFHPAPGPLSVRVEGGYDRFEVKNSIINGIANAVGADVSSNVHFVRGNANLLLRVPTTAGVRPYLTAGVGIYGIGGSTSYSAGGSTYSQSDNTQTKFGINGGVGAELPLSGITVFLEARAHGVQTDATPLTYVPITVGIRF